MEAPKPTIKRAKALRGAMSLPEVLLWRVLRKRTLSGLRFRRQHPVGPYVLDFYCEEARLAIEVDGEHHGLGDRPGRDARRDAWLARRGVRVLRLPARLVLQDMPATADAILAAVGAPSVRPSA